MGILFSDFETKFPLKLLGKIKIMVFTLGSIYEWPSIKFYISSQSDKTAKLK